MIIVLVLIGAALLAVGVLSLMAKRESRRVQDGAKPGAARGAGGDSGA